MNIIPNQFGEYDDTPEYMASVLKDFAKDKLLNIAMCKTILKFSPSE